MPLPELNPLLNPVLGENMGRWAEVYYRNPPENREQAVLELLQQLENENSPRQGGVTAQPLPHASAQDSASFPAQSAQSSERIIRCRSCGHENDNRQRFCGMCGRPLLESEAGSFTSKVEDGVADDSRQEVLSASDAHLEKLRNRAKHYASGDSSGDDHADSEGLIRSLGYAPASTSYRPYIGVVLVIIIAALGYIAWRGSHARGSSPLTSEAPPSTTAPPAQQPPAPTAPKAVVPTPDSSGAETAATRTPDEHEGQSTNTAKAELAKNPSGAAATKQADTKEAQAGAVGNGSEELAIANSYLNPSAGTQPNTVEAVDWLWKAVAKRNTEATLLLSDLYLRGSGIAKNCDQARVLLDAAASRGTKEAAVRLRNMQAFGCP
jgi:hypothetical protein